MALFTFENRVEAKGPGIVQWKLLKFNALKNRSESSQD